MRTTPQRIVERAALRPQNALERFPVEIAQPAEPTDLATEMRPDLLERADQGGAGAGLVEGNVYPGARLAVSRVEGEEVNRSVAFHGRLERAGQDDADTRGSIAACRDVLPRCGRHEGLDRARGRVARLLVSPRMQLRDRDAASVDVHERVHQRGQAQAQPAPRVGDTERDDDRTRQGHVQASQPGVFL